MKFLQQLIFVRGRVGFRPLPVGRKQSAKFAVAAKGAPGLCLQQIESLATFGQFGFEVRQRRNGVCQPRFTVAFRLGRAFLYLLLSAPFASADSLPDLLGDHEMGLGDPRFPLFEFGPPFGLFNFKVVFGVGDGHRQT